MSGSSVLLTRYIMQLAHRPQGLGVQPKKLITLLDWTCWHAKAIELKPRIKELKRLVHVIGRKPDHRSVSINEKKIMNAECEAYHLVGDAVKSSTWVDANLVAIEFVLRTSFSLEYYDGQVDTGHWIWLCLLANLITRKWDALTPFTRGVFSDYDIIDLKMCNKSFCDRLEKRKRTRELHDAQMHEYFRGQYNHMSNIQERQSKRFKHDTSNGYNR